MKRILGMLALSAVGLLVLFATPGDTHKILWCHFPPGQFPDKVIILSIDVAAGPDPVIPPAHANHQGDGPAHLDSNGAPVCDNGGIG